MDERELEAARELDRILAVLTELTGLPSNWSGRLELVPDADFKGRKPFSCDVSIDEALAALPQRWSTLIHEALHALSAGYVPLDLLRTPIRARPGLVLKYRQPTGRRGPRRIREAFLRARRTGIVT